MEVAKECNSAMNADKENSLKLSIQNSLGTSFVLTKASRKLIQYVVFSLPSHAQTPCCWLYKHQSIEATAFLFSDLLIITNRFDSELSLQVLSKNELCLFLDFH